MKTISLIIFFFGLSLNAEEYKKLDSFPADILGNYSYGKTKKLSFEKNLIIQDQKKLKVTGIYKTKKDFFIIYFDHKKHYWQLTVDKNYGFVIIEHDWDDDSKFTYIRLKKEKK